MPPLAERLSGPRPVPDILIVEDDADSRWVLSALLRRVGFTCIAVGNGLEALEAVENKLPTAILMDCAMPSLDGLDAARRLKADARTRRIPVLMMTAGVTKPSAEEVRKAGCDELICKPIDFNFLLGKLQRHIAASPGKPAQSSPACSPGFDPLS